MLEERPHDSSVGEHISGIGNVDQGDGEVERGPRKRDGGDGGSVGTLVRAIVGGFQFGVGASDVQNDVQRALREGEDSGPIAGDTGQAQDGRHNR